MSSIGHISSSNHTGFTGFFSTNANFLPSHSPSKPLFDSRSPGTRFHAEAVPLGRGAARDAAGRAGSLRGPAASFYALPETNQRLSAAALQNKRLTGWFFIDSRERSVYKLSNRPHCAAPVGMPHGPFVSLKTLFSERPHECQIGSGEGIRTSVRGTFESHWLRSIRISVGVLSGFFHRIWLRPFETRLIGLDIWPVVPRLERFTALHVFARQADTHATKTVHLCRKIARLSPANFLLLAAYPADLSAPGHERALVAA
jgi:hypothetical protein